MATMAAMTRMASWDQTVWIYFALAVVLAYLIGNFSPASMLASMHGIDIHKEGSGNAGTTNVARTLGKGPAAATLAIDIAKGFLAVYVAGAIGTFAAENAGEAVTQVSWFFAFWCALAVFLGHVWPVVYRFKGGKGVATAFGAILQINLWLGLSCLGVVILAVVISRRMSVGSIAGALSFPVFCWLFMPGYLPAGCIMALIILIKHRGNIGRLMRGEEPKLRFHKKKAETEAEQENGAEKEDE